MREDDNLMREIPLTKGRVALVDTEDYERLSKHSWYYDQNGYAYRRKTTGYRESVLVPLHREIIGIVPRGKVIDHVNRDKLDNRRRNLRITTQSNNAANSPPREGTSKYKGVSWHKSSAKWIARLEKEGIRYFLGLFNSEVNAAIAYNDKAKCLYGEYAYLNDVPRSEINWDVEYKTSSEYLGITKIKETGKYRSYFRKDGKQVHLGYFHSEEMAVKIRDLWVYDAFKSQELMNTKGVVVAFG